MQEFVKRMIVEREDLKGKINRAKKAIENPPFGSDREGIEMLKKQVEGMETYLFWLCQRLDKEGV
jgi:hypothetical protein